MKAVTFPGQGTAVGLSVFRCYLAETSRRFQSVFGRPERASVLASIERKPAEPASIAACSYLLFDLYRQFSRSDEQLVFLGHSLGELGCLGAGNGLFGLTETMEVAAYRNRLMVEAVHGTQYGMWAVSAPRSRNLALELRPLLSNLGIALANVNTNTQCVVTGLELDGEHWTRELSQHIPRCRIQKLENPYHIPFHNRDILGSIQEPLLDFMWKKLKRDGGLTPTSLRYPMISNATGELISNVDRALESFAASSCNVVEFVSCCNTLNKLGVHEAVHLGPGTVVSKLVRRNCDLQASYEWNTVEDILSASSDSLE